MSDGRSEHHEGNRELALLISARRAKRLRNGLIAGVVAFGVAAATLSGSNVPVVWAEDYASPFRTPGEQLMRDRLRADVDHENNGLTAEELRELSERRLQAFFDATESGLWDRNCGEDDKGEDYQECLRDDSLPENHEEAEPVRSVEPGIKAAAASIPVLMGAGRVLDGIRGLGRRLPSSSQTSGNGASGGSGGADVGIPIGAIEGGLTGRVLPLDESEPGVGSIPEDPTEDGGDEGGDPSPPINPGAPDGEVPIPAPFILFPAGLAVLRFLKR